MKQGERVQVISTASQYAGMTGLLKKRVAASRTRGGSGYYVLLDNGERVKFFKDELTSLAENHEQELMRLREAIKPFSRMFNQLVEERYITSTGCGHHGSGVRFELYLNGQYTGIDLSSTALAELVKGAKP